MRWCCRNYPRAIFDRLRGDLIDIIIELDGLNFVQSRTLGWLKEKMILIGIDRNVGKKFIWNEKRDNRKMSVKLNERDKVQSSTCFNVRNNVERMSGVGNFFPIWSNVNPTTLTVSDGCNITDFKVYDPVQGYFPNPFSDFMIMINKKC